ncbi:glycosyltransferase family protein [Microbacterium tumbae]
MLALFDAYDDATRELLQSLTTAGIPFATVVIRYDGELPDGALSPFTEYTGIERTGRPLFFDEVPVPAWSEIRQGREPYAQILRDGRPIGRIHYEPDGFRQVESVDWVLPDGTPTHTDHWDRYGNQYATTHHSGGIAYQTAYRGPSGRQIEVDHASRVVTLRSPQSQHTFGSLAEFVSHFLEERGIPDDHVLINSLSHPLFTMRRRAGRARTTLVWQEPMPGDVPGNMASELDAPRALTRVVFCDDRLRRTVAERHPGTAIDLAYLSHIGQFADKRGYDLARTFTLTSSDALPALPALLEAFPGVTFSVAALTLMSEKLHSLARAHPNLRLTPRITHTGIREELARASTYLDINGGTHVLDVVKAAYHLDLVVLALAPQAKAPDHELVLDTPEQLAARLADATADEEGRRRQLDALHQQRGPLSTPDDWRRLLASPQSP